MYVNILNLDHLIGLSRDSSRKFYVSIFESFQIFTSTISKIIP